MKILVVDDFATMRQIVKKSLRQLGFDNITEAIDGLDALNKLRADEYKFIVSDWNMPNMMGIDLLKSVRGDEKLKTIPFLMITAEAQKETLERSPDTTKFDQDAANDLLKEFGL